MVPGRYSWPLALLRPRPPRTVYGYLRPRPKTLAYIRAVPKQYDVAYPYGVGGDSILDRVAEGVNFDNWVTSAILGYVYNR